MIYGADWNDAVGATSLPLTDSGNNRVTWNAVDQTWDIYIGGVRVLRIDTGGNLFIAGQVNEGATL